MNKEQIDKILEILIDFNDGEYDEQEQQAIMVFTELLQLLGIDKNYNIKNVDDVYDIIDDDIFYIAMKQIEKGDYEYFKTTIMNERQEIYEDLMYYSYDFETKKNYINQHCNTLDSFNIRNLADITDLMKLEKDDLNINEIMSKQQDFVKWCVENVQKLDSYDINNLINKQGQIIELSIKNVKETGCNITDIVNEHLKFIMLCFKDGDLELDICDFDAIMDEAYNLFTSCIENAKDIVLNGGDLEFLIQSYKNFYIEAGNYNSYNKYRNYSSINEDSLEEIAKWYNENKDTGKDDVSHFINEFSKKCIELDFDDDCLLNIIKNNINDPEYIKRTNRK